MDNSEHIHRFSLKAWIFNTLLGSFLLLLVFGVLAIKLISATSKLSDYLGFALLAFLLFPLGIALLIFPFVTKIVVKGSGLEYHSATSILRAGWKDLVNIGYREHTPAGKTLVVVALGGKLELRNWATPFRNIFVKQPQGIEILVSQFGPADGHSFETDILVNVTEHEGFADELEPL